jgi:hypothetical protein
MPNIEGAAGRFAGCRKKDRGRPKPILPTAPTSTVVEREFILTGANVSATGEVTDGQEFEHDS